MIHFPKYLEIPGRFVVPLLSLLPSGFLVLFTSGLHLEGCAEKRKRSDLDTGVLRYMLWPKVRRADFRLMFFVFKWSC